MTYQQRATVQYCNNSGNFQAAIGTVDYDRPGNGSLELFHKCERSIVLRFDVFLLILVSVYS